MHTAQEIVNRCLWLTGLSLQCALLVALFARREARRFPAFTLLLAFYVVRTTLLYSLSGHLAAATFSLLYVGFSWVDLLLQLLVAAEIARHIARQGNTRTLRLVGIVFFYIGFSAWIAWLSGVMVRSYPRIALDRGQVFTSCLMMLLLGWAWWRSTVGPVRRIVEGFAVYGLVALAAEAGKIHAFIHRDARSYLIWSYVPAITFLGIVIFWLLGVKRASGRQSTEAALPSLQGPLWPEPYPTDSSRPKNWATKKT